MNSPINVVIAIETSCDDTSVAVVTSDGFVRGVLSANQNSAHEVFGGIVPEIACRNHTFHLLPLVDACLDRAGVKLQELDGVVVTAKPGLIGSLLVGVVTAKALALSLNKPIIGVNHLEGHLLAPFLKDDLYAPPADFKYPYIALAISGGHTSLYRIDGLGEYRVLGQTIDDAAGEAFDKFGKMVGLGFPGGVRVDRHAQFGDVNRFSFPRSMLNENHFNFSFSGLKSAAQRVVDGLSSEDKKKLLEDLAVADQARKKVGAKGAGLVEEGRPGVLADLCASYQEAIVDVLMARVAKSVESEKLERAVLTGGVSANSRLRLRALEWAQTSGVELVVPPIRYCTDNAAMIGCAGILRMNRGEFSDQTLGAEPRAPLGIAPLPDQLPSRLRGKK